MLKSLLGLFIQDVVKDAHQNIAKREALAQLGEGARREFLRHVSEGFLRETEFNFSQYIRSVGRVSAEIESEGNEGERLFQQIQSALRQVEIELEEMGPDSPVAQYLLRRYGASTQSFVGRESASISSMFGIPAPVPWLNKPDESVNEMIAEEASRILKELLNRPQNT